MRRSLILSLAMVLAGWVPTAGAQAPKKVEKRVEVKAGDGGKTVERRVVVLRDDEGEGGGVADGEKGARIVFVSAGDGDEMVQHVEIEGEGPHALQWVAEHMRRHGYLGVELVDMTPELRRFFGAPEDAGVLIARVEAGSPAERAGLEVGDVVTSVAEESVASSWDVRRRVRAFEQGESAPLRVVRERQPLRLTATIEERERPEVDVRHFLHRLPQSPGEPLIYRFDTEGMTGAIEGLRERFTDPNVKVYMKQLQGMEGDLEGKLKSLEEQMQKMQEELERLRQEKE